MTNYLMKVEKTLRQGGSDFNWGKAADAIKELVAEKKYWENDSAAAWDMCEARKLLAEKAEAERDEGKREADILATLLWERHYKDAAPDWKLLNTVSGVISQIDNMTAGIVAELDELREEIEDLKHDISSAMGFGADMEGKANDMEALAAAIERTTIDRCVYVASFDSTDAIRALPHTADQSALDRIVDERTKELREALAWYEGSEVDRAALSRTNEKNK